MGLPIAIVFTVLTITLLFSLEWQRPLAFLHRHWPSAAWDRGTLFIYALLATAGVVVVLLFLYMMGAL